MSGALDLGSSPNNSRIPRSRSVARCFNQPSRTSLAAEQTRLTNRKINTRPIAMSSMLDPNIWVLLSQVLNLAFDDSNYGDAGPTTLSSFGLTHARIIHLTAGTHFLILWVATFLLLAARLHTRAGPLFDRPRET